jgi:hypothetical protein
MPEHSYRCECGERATIYYAINQYPYPEELPCRCGKRLVRFFERAPGMAPDIWHPYYDHQLGSVVTSRAQRDRVAKEKGLAIMGREEFDRSRKAHTPKDEMPFDRERWRDAADKAYNDLKYGNVAIPEMPTVDTADAAVVESN